MRTANQLTFATYEASLKIIPNDSIQVTFYNIDWSFIHPLVKEIFTSRELVAINLILSSKDSSLFA